jgi:hypothetical protein
LINILVVSGVITYILLGIIYIVAIWSSANSRTDAVTKTELRRHAARLTLIGPFWLFVVIFYEIRGLLKTAGLWPPKKPKVSHELCPECRKKIKRGPMR